MIILAVGPIKSNVFWTIFIIWWFILESGYLILIKFVLVEVLYTIDTQNYDDKFYFFLK